MIFARSKPSPGGSQRFFHGIEFRVIKRCRHAAYRDTRGPEIEYRRKVPAGLAPFKLIGRQLCMCSTSSPFFKRIGGNSGKYFVDEPAVDSRSAESIAPGCQGWLRRGLSIPESCWNPQNKWRIIRSFMPIKAFLYQNYLLYPPYGYLYAVLI